MGIKPVVIDHNPGRVISLEGKDRLFFGGTAYLGVQSDPQFRRLIIEGAEKYGFSTGISRLNNVRSGIYRDAEQYAAAYFGAEDAVILSSGYLAAQQTVHHLATDRGLMYAPESHPALFRGQPGVTVATADMASWINNSSNGRWLICSNSLNNLHPCFYDFKPLCKVERDVVLLADDSHGIGITGRDGRGIYRELCTSQSLQVVVVASMAKALGIDAGVVLGTAGQMDSLRQTAMYAGASPPSPAMLYAFMHAAPVYKIMLERLQENMAFFNSLVSSKKGINYVSGFPVYQLEAPDAADRLLAEGILISSFAYPDPEGIPLNRIVINALHTRADLERLASLL